MSTLQDFWNQPNKDLRNARLLFAVLTIGFAVAAVLYAIAPGFMVAQFHDWDRLLGGSGVEYPEMQNRVWVSLAVANVATLSLMSWLLWTDLLKNRAVHLPLFFMKTTSAALFTLYWFARTDARSLLVAAAGDFVTGALVWYLPMRAFRSLEQRSTSVSGMGAPARG
jgi:hypothetical protein